MDATWECSDEVRMIEILHILSLSFFSASSFEVTMEGQMQFVSDCKIQKGEKRRWPDLSQRYCPSKDHMSHDFLGVCNYKSHDAVAMKCSSAPRPIFCVICDVRGRITATFQDYIS